MSIRRIHVTLVITALLVIGIGGPASAQPAISEAPIKSGKVYWVTRTDGSEINGFITARTATEVRVSGALGEVTIPAEEVLRIQKPDGLKEGFLGGAALGAVMVVLGNDERYSVGQKMGVGAVYALATGGLGALIDKAVQGRTDVYRRVDTPHVSLAPIASARRLGLRATVRW